MKPRVLVHDVTGAGDPLVLVPGGLTGWVSWLPHVDRLSRSHRVIRVQPIHNELGSAATAGDTAYDSAVERESLRLTLQELGVESAFFAGWSRGGGALLDYTMAVPEQVRSLVLIEPAAEWVLEGRDEHESLPDPEMREFVANLAGADVSEDDLAEFLVFAGLAPSRQAARAHPMWASWVPHRAAISWPYEPVDPKRRSVDALAGISCPVLLVKGTSSTRWDRRVVDVLGEVIPNARVVELEGGHASHIESIDQFLAEIEHHLGSVPEPSDLNDRADNS